MLTAVWHLDQTAPRSRSTPHRYRSCASNALSRGLLRPMTCSHVTSTARHVKRFVRSDFLKIASLPTKTDEVLVSFVNLLSL
jgi:hypothetical protein